MKHSTTRATYRRLFAVVACAAALIGATSSPASAHQVSTTSIVYSDTYKKLIAAFPSGYADRCAISAMLNGRSGICDARVEVAYFYPDGTLGPRPWRVDPSSSTGWSVEPDPCEGLTDAEYALWAAYVDWSAGYLDAPPQLSANQIERYSACWGYWF